MTKHDKKIRFNFVKKKKKNYSESAQCLFKSKMG